MHFRSVTDPETDGGGGRESGTGGRGGGISTLCANAVSYEELYPIRGMKSKELSLGNEI